MRGMMTGVANKFKSGPTIYPETAFYNSFLFNGSTEWVDVADSASLDLSATISMSAWVYPTDVTTEHAIIAKYDFTGGQRSYVMYITGGTLNVILHTGVGHSFTSGAVININEWQHVMFTYDGTDGKLYRNGVEILTLNDAGISITNSSSELTIGSYSGSSNGSFSFVGSITQPMVFNSGLISGQVTTIYNSGLPLLYNLIDTAITDDAVMSFEMSSNDDTLVDESTSSNDGTANGGVTSDGIVIEWDIL